MADQKLALAGDYVKVKRKNSGELTFGGDQNFFAVSDRTEDKLKGWNFRKLPEDEKKRRMGCGIVALSDLFLYLAGRNGTDLKIKHMSYVNRMLAEKDYCQYYNAVLDFTGKITKNGVSGLKLSRRFNRMARRQHWKERAFWGFSKKKMLPRIEEMLGKDIPAILCIPMAILRKDKERRLTFYHKNEQGDYVKSTSANGHYVVVTELFSEKEERYLVISSWGKQYFVRWKEYEEMVYSLFLGGLLGNLLYIR